MEDTDYGIRPEPSRATVIIKLVLKILFLALIIFIYGFFMLRICTSEPEQRIIWTDRTLAAYNEAGADFSVYTQEHLVFIDEYKNKTIPNQYDENGVPKVVRYGYNISIFDITYIPAAHQLQVTVRYNKSILKDLADEYGLDAVEGEPFIFSLLFEDGERKAAYKYAATETSRYYFKYLVFDDVYLDDFTLISYTPQNAAVTDEEGNILAHETDENGGSILYETNENGQAIVYDNYYIYLDTYFINDVNFDENPISSLIVYQRSLPMNKLDHEKFKSSSDGLTIRDNPGFVNKGKSNR